MQKQNPIDDLFRRGLADYRVSPSDERKEEFIREVTGKQGKRPWAGWWFIAGTVLILAGVGISLLLSKSTVTVEDAKFKTGGSPASSVVSPEMNKVVVEKTAAERGDVKAVKAGKAPSSGETHVTGLNTSGVKTSQKAVTSHAAGHKPSNGLASSRTPKITSEKPAADLHETTAVSVPPAEPSAVIKVNESTTVQLTKNDEKTSTPENPVMAAAVVPPSVESKAEPAVKPAESTPQPNPLSEEKEPAHKESSHPQKNWNISTGIYYTPEWMFNTLNGDKYVNNMGIEGTFHFGNYSVRTGLGLSITNGWHEVLVQSNPYLGSYKALDSITFTWNKTGTKLNPTYYMTGTSVYDTAREYTYSYVQKRYTYLQLPLMLGYDFWNNNWLRLGVRAGAVMSLLLNTQNLTTTYDPGKDRVVSINNVSPDRIQLNWQAIGGINASIGWSRRFSIELEPEIRYYFNSVYESSEITTKPWSIGVRAAFLIKF